MLATLIAVLKHHYCNVNICKFIYVVLKVFWEGKNSQKNPMKVGETVCNFLHLSVLCEGIPGGLIPEEHDKGMMTLFAILF